MMEVVQNPDCMVERLPMILVSLVDLTLAFRLCSTAMGRNVILGFGCIPICLVHMCKTCTLKGSAAAGIGS
ncbi:g11854 [Coccomyxa viridis]|uniref:G11854 protein n=1 Tax=Coccomyxa viridis TaxID=1274662 RepID=A0ABP1G8X2_9CHLO